MDLVEGRGSPARGRLASAWLATACATATSWASCPADLDGDGWVGGPDLTMLLGNWTGTGTGDLNGDGLVGGGDLAALLAAWGPCPVTGPIDVVREGVNGALDHDLARAASRALLIPRESCLAHARSQGWRRVADLLLAHLAPI